MDNILQKIHFDVGNFILKIHLSDMRKIQMNYLKLLSIIMLNLLLFWQPSTSMAFSHCIYKVINVKSWDTLSVRKWPGIKSRIIYNLAANTRGIELTGRSRQLRRYLWVQIRHNGITGWINRSYLEEDCDGC